MAENISELSVAQLTRRYVDEARPVTAQLLARLKRDGRQGVRRLHARLRKRFEKERDERQRLDGLLNFERVLWQSGVERIAGVDEAGIGPLAGPVVAAAVVFPPHVVIDGVDDSKRLDAETRERLAVEIHERASHVGIGLASVSEIDRCNIRGAGLLAMRRALDALSEPPQHVLVDAFEIPDVAVPQNRFCKGDGLDYSIAAASIVAKTHRDALMRELDAEHPEYGFARHAGYSTPEHQEAIRRHGPCPAHRSSFTFIRELCGEYSPTFYDLRRRLDGAPSRSVLADVERELERRGDQLEEREHRKLRLLVTRRWKLV